MLFQYDFRLPPKSELFIGTILLQLLSWSQVIITFDRFIAVQFPIKGVRIMRKKLVLYSMIFGMFVVIVGLNSPHFFIPDSKYTVNNVTYTNNIMRGELGNFIKVIRLLMKLSLPYLIMVCLDLAVNNRMRNRIMNISQANSINKSSKFTRNTILIDLIYLIFNFPSTFFDLFFFLYQLFPKLPIFPSILQLTILKLFTLSPFVYSSLIFILFIIFNRIFRAEFIAMLNQQRCFIFVKNLLLFAF